MTTLRLLAIFCILAALAPAPAIAYIDPVAGSIFLQVLIAGILGGLLAFKRAGFIVKSTLSRLWRRLTG
ncbi:MAG TPA: hypothetical protein VNO75_00835 [Gemmatimonadaceae bacterium]|nr:hypothetical protein [Gemmatimonadaceae bacterium]